MKKILLIVISIIFCFSGIASAEITKTFDKFEGKISVESSKTANLNDALDVKISISKLFFSYNGFQDINACNIKFELLSKSQIAAQPISDRFYWMKQNESFGHEERFLRSPASSIMNARMSMALKKAISENEPMIIKLPLLVGNDQFIKISPETLKEWTEVITYDISKNPIK
jgi:hypothetical protein